MYSGSLRRGNIDRGNFNRVLLTDTAPLDVPIVFSNDGFHANLGRTPTAQGLARIIKAMVSDNRERYTIPYRYRIRLTTTSSRQLSLAHPAAQWRACAFYREYGHLIPYFCRHSDVSLRRPAKIGSAFFYAGRTAERKRYKGAAIDMLLQDETVRNPGSFFAYDGYDRFYKFFNSEEFVRLEKKFSMMRLTDISKCFSSIYSHTLAWAVKDVQHGKESTKAGTFANDFDSLMQYSNYNETNGIPVGAEVSRIFAEIILQSAEASVLRKAKRKMTHETDFAIRRYIDDYVIFANDTDTLNILHRYIAEALLTFNLHLNEAKTHTISRPLQTRRSQIVSGASPALSKFRDSICRFEADSQLSTPNNVREPQALLRGFANDVKVACTNGSAGYDDVSPVIVGSIGSTIENLIASFPSASKKIDNKGERYVKAFDVLLSALYYFFTMHATVTTSYQVAKATILSVRFFKMQLADAAESIYERVRVLIQEMVHNPSLSSIAMSDYVPIEMLNIIIASTELSLEYRVDIDKVHRRVVTDVNIDYFSTVSLLFYFRRMNEPSYAREIERKLERQFLKEASPRRSSHDAHFLLDLIACPFLSRAFRRNCVDVVFKELQISPSHYSNNLIDEIEKNPWFVNWQEVDLLNQLRKKELRAVY